MSLHSSRDPSRFNSPGVMAARSLYLLHLGMLPTGMAFVMIALSQTSPLHALAAGGCGMTMVVIRSILRKSGRWEDCEKAFSRSFSYVETGEGEPGGVRLIELLERRAEIETLRGQPEFDPWALQEVRREIAALLKENPKLTRLADEFEA